MSALLAAIKKNALLEEEELGALLRWRPYEGSGLAERIYRSGVLSDTQLVELFVGLGAQDATAEVLSGLPPPAALGAITRQLAERHRALPLRVERARLVVALLDPSDTQAIEKITFFCGLAVEPRAVRARALFQALSEAFGIAAPVPDGAFLARSRTGDATGDDVGYAVPAPSPDLVAPSPAPPVPSVSAPPAGAPSALPAAPTSAKPETTADPARSPLARVMAEASGFAGKIETAESAFSLPTLRDIQPARSPEVRLPLDELHRVRASLPLPSALDARDSLPPQVLRLLAPPLRSAVLFLVRGDVAVGWDGKSPHAGRAEVRDLLLPLTAASVFERAVTWQRVAVGNPADPTTTERMMFRALRGGAPSSFAAVPIVVGERVVALLWIDRETGMLDDTHVQAARQVGQTLADGLAPFVAAATLFPAPPSARLPPISRA